VTTRNKPRLNINIKTSTSTRKDYHIIFFNFPPDTSLITIHYASYEAEYHAIPQRLIIPMNLLLPWRLSFRERQNTNGSLSENKSPNS
jgi:hypothetical protein